MGGNSRITGEHSGECNSLSALINKPRTVSRNLGAASTFRSSLGSASLQDFLLFRDRRLGDGRMGDEKLGVEEAVVHRGLREH